MEPYTDIDSFDRDPEIATALGNMVVAWATAETALMFAMCAICEISTDMAHFGFYRIPTFEARVKFLQGMIPAWSTTQYDKDEISRTIDRISRLSATRNNWVHGVWSKHRSTDEVVVFNFRAKEGSGRIKPVKAQDINHHAMTLRQATNLTAS
ncbi:hypothetical protein [Consotaella aegiceratis]|uniref:hypothetical protein n=1 Tax=Consotaella aegiceratis TaxID=3097961 RepID=UPI002F42ABB2